MPFKVLVAGRPRWDQQAGPVLGQASRRVRLLAALGVALFIVWGLLIVLLAAVVTLVALITLESALHRVSLLLLLSLVVRVFMLPKVQVARAGLVEGILLLWGRAQQLRQAGGSWPGTRARGQLPSFIFWAWGPAVL